jgi:hypothetical protein
MNTRGEQLEAHEIGNLCLITGSSNSQYNDDHFEYKKSLFATKNTTESLKQTIMFSYDEWNTENIKAHENMMMAMLEKFMGK